jgi:hypothetical protein
MPWLRSAACLGRCRVKFDSFKAMNEAAGEKGIPGVSVGIGGGDDFLSRIHSAIVAFRDALKIMQELKGMGQEFKQPGAQVPIIDSPKQLQKPNPGLAKFLEQYGDMTVNQALKAIGPMTIKQLIEMAQHGIRPSK